MRLIYLTFLFCFLASFAYNQNFKTQPLNKGPIRWKDSASLYFEYSNTNFFKNNEYSNDILNGYTLFGFNAAPELSYYLSENTKIKGGANFLKYFGEKGFHEIKPLFQVEQKFSSNLSLIFGSIKNSNCHDLISPLYNPELLLIDPTEYGLQFLFQNKRFDIDLWLDWQRFITEKSDFQEEFITGFNSEIRLLSDNAPIKLLFPTQMVIKHKGGQIGNQEEPVSTLVNTATGVGLKLPLKTDDNSLKFETLITGYHKITDKSNEPFNKGLGLFSRLNFRINAFDLHFSYWQGSNYISVAGDPIYQSYSLKKDKKMPKRKILKSGLQYSQKFRYTKLAVNFQWIYDLNLNNPDYVVGLYLYLNLNRILLSP
jgi:hypothetical protein